MQTQQINRVKRKIGQLVTDFVYEVWQRSEKTFYVGELQQYVRARLPAAPASPDRILRQLRREGMLDYEVIDRSASRYRVLSVTKAEVRPSAEGHAPPSW